MMKTLAAMALTAILTTSCDRIAGPDSRVERADAHYRAAMADYQAGRLEAAVAGFEKTVNANPLNASARFQLACLKEESKKDYLGAIVEYREFLRLSPKGEKAVMAKNRLSRCMEHYAAECAEGNAPKDRDAAAAAAIASLKAENKRISSELEEVQRKAASLAGECERLKMMVRAVGEGEDAAARPVKIALDDRELLEDDGDEGEKKQVLSEAAKLKEDDDDKAAAPFAGSSAAVAPAKEKRAAAAQPERPKKYVVQEGETLTAIARRFYGNGKQWRKIQEANRAVISVDGKVDAGMEITLP